MKKTILSLAAAAFVISGATALQTTSAHATWSGKDKSEWSKKWNDHWAKKKAWWSNFWVHKKK